MSHVLGKIPPHDILHTDIVSERAAPSPIALEVLAMRMYTLWKLDPKANEVARLEHEGRPVLFAERTEAEAYGRGEAAAWNEDVRVFPVIVGQA